jgi:hypothetical protein
MAPAAKAARAPRLSRFLPGSASGREAMRADSLRNATIDPVKVTAPMATSAWWMPMVRMEKCVPPAFSQRAAVRSQALSPAEKSITASRPNSPESRPASATSSRVCSMPSDSYST